MSLLERHVDELVAEVRGLLPRSDGRPLGESAARCYGDYFREVRAMSTGSRNARPQESHQRNVNSPSGKLGAGHGQRLHISGATRNGPARGKLARLHLARWSAKWAEG
jgi:hypothetical protein